MSIRNSQLLDALSISRFWVKDKLPDRTLANTKAKLLEEIGELVASDFTDPQEYADVLIVLDDLAEQHGIDLGLATMEKAHINMDRVYKQNSKGVYRHEENNE